MIQVSPGAQVPVAGKAAVEPGVQERCGSREQRVVTVAAAVPHNDPVGNDAVGDVIERHAAKHCTLASVQDGLLPNVSTATVSPTPK